jgi:hypothetical protein
VQERVSRCHQWLRRHVQCFEGEFGAECRGHFCVDTLLSTEYLEGFLVFACFFWFRSWYGTNTLSYRRILGMDFLGLEPNIGRHWRYDAQEDIIHTKTSGRVRPRCSTGNCKIGLASVYLTNMFRGHSRRAARPSGIVYSSVRLLKTQSTETITSIWPSSIDHCQHDSALIAQLVERVTSNDEVAGSTPS